jgi:hypothetical protein
MMMQTCPPSLWYDGWGHVGFGDRLLDESMIMKLEKYDKYNKIQDLN